MKAVLNKKAGPPEVLEVQKIQKPSPASNEILIKVHASTVTHGDVVMRKLNALFCEAEYPAAGCVGSMNKAKPDPKEKIL